MDIKTYATILLVIRIVSMILIGVVLYKQLMLFKRPIDKEITHYRRLLFFLALAIFLGNIIPALIDILTIFGDLERSARIVKPISVIYTMDAAGTSVLSSLMIFAIYRNALHVDKTHTDSEHTLMNNES